MLPSCPGTLSPKFVVRLQHPSDTNFGKRVPLAKCRGLRHWHGRCCQACRRALGYLLGGDPFSAQEAMAIGLVNAVVPHDDLERRAEYLAGRIIAHSPRDRIACTLGRL